MIIDVTCVCGHPRSRHEHGSDWCLDRQPGGHDCELFRPAPIPFEPYLRRKQRAACLHPAFEVSDDEADLTCADCGKQIDPWWVLRKLAREGDRFEHAIEAGRAEAKRLDAEITALKKERDNLRAQVRRRRKP